MRLLGWTLIGAAAYAAYKAVTGKRPAAGSSEAAAIGLAAIFASREAADLAVEHLVQEHGVDPAAIFVEAAGESNTAGNEISGGDAASGGSDGRGDAPLNGSLRLTLALEDKDGAVLRQVLNEAGGQDIRAI